MGERARPICIRQPIFAYKTFQFIVYAIEKYADMTNTFITVCSICSRARTTAEQEVVQSQVISSGQLAN